MKELANTLQNLRFDDLRPYAQEITLHGDDLLIVEKLGDVDLSQVAIRTSFFTIAACTQGFAQFVLNGKECHVTEGDLFITFGRQTIDHFHKSEDFQGIALFQSQEFVQESLMTMRYLWPYLIYLMRHPVMSLTNDERAIVRRHPIMSLSQEERKIIKDGYALLKHRLASDGEVFRQELIQAILQVFYLDVCRMMEKRAPREEHYNSRTYNLFYHFMQLLASNYMDEREVAWYAEELSLTPKYLSEVVKTVSGRTVGQWISIMVVMEIKSLLRNTDMSVKQIAQQLNFTTQSFMGRYFKNVTGLSPLDYRKRFTN